jgi:DNA-binding NarL/FixJ family response regulator
MSGAQVPQAIIRVLLVDDHALVRAGIRSLLSAMPRVEVVGEAASGEDALAIAERERPDIVLMDIAMKGITGLEAAARIRDQWPSIRVVILSMHSGEEYVLQALRAGAAGYLLKDAATGELELALRSVIRGESWLSPAVSRQVVEGYVQRSGVYPGAFRQDDRNAPRPDHGASGHPGCTGPGSLRHQDWLGSSGPLDRAFSSRRANTVISFSACLSPFWRAAAIPRL